MDDNSVRKTHAKEALIKTDPTNKNSFSYLCKYTAWNICSKSIM